MVWFRLSGKLKRFRWIGSDMTLKVSDPIQVTVTIKEGGNREPNEPYKDAVVNITHEAVVSEHLERELDGRIQRRFIGSFSVEPYSVQAEIDNIRLQMQGAAITVINTVRWSAFMHGPAEPFEDLMLLYSFDQEQWGLITGNLIYRRTTNFPRGYSEEWQTRLQAMLDRGQTEPVGHDLFRAAWDSRIANPRASLFLGTASIEVGTKDCIARLIPESTWLVDNLPAPPVFRIIKDYLPMLLEERGNLSVYAPPREFIATIHRGVEQRNTLAHKLGDSERYRDIPKALEYLNLEELLRTIGDLLWLYDGYCGRPHAFNHIRSGTKQNLIDRYGGKQLPEPCYTRRGPAS